MRSTKKSTNVPAAALHVARTLALLVEALGPEDLPTLGRALMRRVDER